MSTRKILSLGQCFADHSSISTLMRRHFGAEVIGADTLADAQAQLHAGGFHLVLVNRVLDYERTSGLDCIAQLKADAALGQVAVMLVSNLEEAQAQAVALGALPGFGKAALGDRVTLARLQRVLADDTAS